MYQIGYNYDQIGPHFRFSTPAGTVNIVVTKHLYNAIHV